MEKAGLDETRGIGEEKQEERGAGKEEQLGIKMFAASAVELLSAIQETKENPNIFRSYLEHLEATLVSVKPVIEDWITSKSELGDLQRKNFAKLSAKLNKGVEVVRKSSKVHSWNFIQKVRYSIKLGKLDEYMRSFFNLELQADIWHDNKQLLFDFQEVLKKVEGLKQRRNGRFMGLYAVPRLPDLVVGFDAPLSELKKELLKEDVKVLGLCGPGGCGKSTLGAMLCQDEEVRGTFTNILFLTVSSSPNLKVIVKTLLEQIGSQVLESELGDEDAIEQLQSLLKEKVQMPILLVLDDVWDETVIDKLSFKIKGYKLLVTSREIFKIYNDTYHSKYPLGTLSEQDAMTMFRHAALLQDGNLNYLPDEDLLNKIVRCCDGFPLAVKVIAKSLCGQPAREWQRVANKLSGGSSVLDFNKYLLERLATSLDSLDPLVLECFLDLGCFREDERIPASALLDIWVELYEPDDEYDAYVNLLELASRSLVDLVERTGKNAGSIDDGLDGLWFVTQHKLLRELAIYQSRQQSDNQSQQQSNDQSRQQSDNQSQQQSNDQSRQRTIRLAMDKREKEGLSRSSRKQEHNQQLNAKLVSIHTGEMSSKSWNDMLLPDVEVLILNFSAREYTLPPFMEKMRKLKVLFIENYGRNHAELSDVTALGYLAYVKRITLVKVLIPSLHKLATPMKNLLKVSLSMCKVGKTLRNCTINVSKMLPNLVEINVDYSDDLLELPLWICDIVGLQKLSLTNCPNLFALPEEIRCLTKLELLRLHACKGLSRLPDSIGELGRLRCLDISDCSDIKELPDGMCKLGSLRNLDMRRCSELKELPPWVTKLVNLKEVICDDDTSNLWAQVNLQNLKVRSPA